MRKQGMDILFPMQLQDAVVGIVCLVCCQLVSLPEYPDLPPALVLYTHRELIDRVMLVRDTLTIDHTEITAPSDIGAQEWHRVTKTKVRGILALLKHAGVLVTNKPPTEANNSADLSGDVGSAILLQLSEACCVDLSTVRSNFIDPYLLQFLEQQVLLGAPISQCWWWALLVSQDAVHSTSSAMRYLGHQLHSHPTLLHALGLNHEPNANCNNVTLLASPIQPSTGSTALFDCCSAMETSTSSCPKLPGHSFNGGCDFSFLFSPPNSPPCNAAVHEQSDQLWEALHNK
jgi:hypothetical protein